MNTPNILISNSQRLIRFRMRCLLYFYERNEMKSTLQLSDSELRYSRFHQEKMRLTALGAKMFVSSEAMAAGIANAVFLKDRSLYCESI
ncbi:hypothetical protein TNCV_4273091 [Trichonephila clavipes]|nr:hypothetical protein TNCV_4273091 [Trichonephila clavipes]